MRFAALFVVVLSGCFFPATYPVAYTETVECWDECGPGFTVTVNAVLTALPAPSVKPTEAEKVLPSPFINSKMRKMHLPPLQPSPYGDSPEKSEGRAKHSAKRHAKRRVTEQKLRRSQSDYFSCPDGCLPEEICCLPDPNGVCLQE